MDAPVISLPVRVFNLTIFLDSDGVPGFLILLGMGGPKRDSRDTVRFDPTELAELTKSDVRTPDNEVARSRTATVHDPMTTGLLAEASRRSQTIELDDETLEEATNAIETVTRHVVRR
jgi:hypothetical protein